MNTIEIVKAIADETRLRIISLILEGNDLCCCEIETILNISQSNASRHMSRLRWVEIIECQKHAQWAHYQICKKTWEAYPFLQPVIDTARGERDQFLQDLELLHQYKSSSATCTTIKQWIQTIPD